MSRNVFADRARAVKVAKILATVPCGKTPAETDIICNWLRGLTVAERAAIARAAGANAPSDETWGQVITQAAARKVAS